MDRGRGRMLPLLALHAASEYYRLPWKPPVTAGLLAANTLIYLRPAFLRNILPSIDEVWFNAHLILKVFPLSLSFAIKLLSISIDITISGLIKFYDWSSVESSLSL
jgi:hypothetical protein